ncbi:hypothetical protein ACFLRP_03260 [Bacteroidota bacterium]
MGKKIYNSFGMYSDVIESGDIEEAWRAIARIIARRHIKNQLNKIKGHTDKKSINHDNDNKSSNG